MSTCHGCGGVVGRDCFNPSECEWIARDMQARAAAEEYTAPLVARIAELEALVSVRPEVGKLETELRAYLAENGYSRNSHVDSLVWEFFRGRETTRSPRGKQ